MASALQSICVLATIVSSLLQRKAPDSKVSSTTERLIWQVKRTPPDLRREGVRPA